MRSVGASIMTVPTNIKLKGGATHLLSDRAQNDCFRQSDVVRPLTVLPNAVRVLGLFPVPPQFASHVALLREIPDIQHGPRLVSGVHLFTDGSTSCGNQASFTISAWAVMLAEQEPLPGLHQTNNRAELYAILQAIWLGGRWLYLQ